MDSKPRELVVSLLHQWIRICTTGTTLATRTADEDTQHLIYHLVIAKVRLARKGITLYHATEEDIVMVVLLTLCKPACIQQFLDYIHQIQDATEPEQWQAFGGWVYVVARHTWLQELRSESAMLQLSGGVPLRVDDSDRDIPDTHTLDPEALVLLRDTLQRVLQALSREKSQHLAIFLLGVLTRKPYKEIAAQYGLTPAAVARIIFTIRKRIRKEFLDDEPAE